MEKAGIKDSLEKDRAIINCFNDAVVLFNKDSLNYSNPISDVNDAAVKLFGYTREEFLSIPVQDVFHKLTQRKLQNARDLSKASEGFCIDNKENTIPVEFYLNCIDEDEEIYMLVIKDISEKRNNEEQLSRYIEEMHENRDLMEKNAYELVLVNLKLEESEERLKELNSSKDKFFSIIAHDLKSPFNSFLGLTELLAEDIGGMQINDVKLHLLELNRSAQNVYSLLENLLNWSCLQTGRFNYSPEFFSPYELENRIKILFEPSLKQKNISYSAIINSDRNIFADRNMTETVMRNLVTNAIKFSHEGGVIAVIVEDEGEMVKFSVHDSGAGIDEDNLKKLFKIESARSTLGTKREKGTGLGLILCKELVELSGGKIFAESHLNKGTTFSFTLPVKIRKGSKPE